MQIEERVFARKVPDFQRLAQYGFTKNEKGQYIFATPFMNKQFQAKVIVDSTGKVQGTVIDRSTGEEYLLLRSVSPGPFASEVIVGYQQVLKDIAQHCFLDVPFKSPQANRIVKLIAEEFGDRPEHIFQNLPHYAVFREPNSTKWYGLVMDVPADKLTGKKALLLTKSRSSKLKSIRKIARACLSCPASITATT
ncbi:MAG: MmcQ family protein [Lactobacillus sp.]